MDALKRWILWTSGLLLLIGLMGCQSGEADRANKTAETHAQDLAQVSVMLDWYPNAVHSYLYVAQEKGYFEQEGVKVEFLFPANPTDPIQLAAAGEITLGITYQPDVIMARAKGIPVKTVAAIVREPLNHIVFLDQTLQSPAQLEGKRVGYPGIPVNESLLKTMVETSGGDFHQVELIDVGFDLGAALISGQADAIIGAYINHEVPVLKQQGYTVHTFNPVDYGVPPFYELVLVTSDTVWSEQEEIIRSFFRAAQKGYHYMKENPEESLDILLAHQDEAQFPLIREVEKESLTILLPKMEAAGAPFGSQRKEEWQTVINWLLESGFINEAPAVDEIFINLVE